MTGFTGFRSPENPYARHPVHLLACFRLFGKKRTHPPPRQTLYSFRLLTGSRKPRESETSQCLGGFSALLCSARSPGEAPLAGFIGFIVSFHPVHPVIPSRGFSPRQKPLNARGYQAALQHIPLDRRSRDWIIETVHSRPARMPAHQSTPPGIGARSSRALMSLPRAAIRRRLDAFPITFRAEAV